MPDLKRIRRLAIVALVSSLLWGCGTPTAVRDLAEKTAANTSFVSTQLNLLAQDARLLAELRAANMARLHAATVEVQVRSTFDEALIEKSGGSLSLLRDLTAWSTKIRTMFETAANAESERKKLILKTQVPLDTPTKELGKVAEALADLAKDDNTKTRAKFIAAFIKQVVKEVKAKKEQSEKAMANVKDGLNKKK